MLKHFALAGFAIAAATSAQAMPRATLQMDGVITQVRQGCGIGMVLVDGQCVSRHDLRVERRDSYGTYGTGGYSGTAYGAYGPHFDVDTPGVITIMRYRDNWGSEGWDGYARRSGIVCVPGTSVTMGDQQYLCQ